MPSELNKNFDKIFVINMERSVDRLEYITEHLYSKNIEWSRFDAVDGHKLKINKVKEEIGFLCRNFCSKSMIGCALSHKRLWEKILNENLNSALIMEDDIEICENYEKQLKKAMKELPDDWDIFLLGCGGMCDKRENDETMFLKILFNLTKSYNANTKSIKANNIFIPKFPTGFYCYAVSKRGCKKLLKTVDKINYHIDYQVSNNFQDINIYAIDPKIARLSDRKSTINEFNFPKSINFLLDKIKDKNGISVSWYMNLVFFEWLGIPFNIWSVIFILFGLSSSFKKYGQINKLIIFIFLIEFISFDKSWIYNLIYVLIGKFIKNIYY